jgi:hypothetical protein
LLFGVAYITWIGLLAPPLAFLIATLYYYIKAGKEEGD